MAGAPTSTGGSIAGGGSASGGTLGCSPELPTNCNGECIDTKTDTMHCGKCDAPCGSAAVCEDGACQCKDGDIKCDGTCVDANSMDNCGRCGNFCSGPTSCVAGSCRTCPTGCAVLSAPLDQEGQRAVFALMVFDPPANLKGATLSLRVYAERTPNLAMTVLVEAPGTFTTDGPSFDVASGWQEYSAPTLNSSAFETTYRISLVLYGTNNAVDGAPDVYVDWIKVDNDAAGSWGFNGSSSPLKFVAGVSDVMGAVTWLKD